MSTMLDKIRADLRARLDERSAKAEEIDTILAAAEERDDSVLTEDETTQFNEARDAVKALDVRIDELQTRATELDELDKRNEEREALAKTLQPEPTPEGERQFRVRSEQSTYRKGGDHSFFQDAYAARFGGSSAAAERLARHDSELRDVTTGALGALVVPVYLPEMFAENLRAGRVTANLCNSLDLPPQGMTINIPRGTTGTVVASQSAQGDALTEVDFDETTLAISVRTIGGQQDVSRQAIERGFNVDEIIFADLASSYAAQLDSQIINGAGTNGTHTGILATTSINSVTTGTATGTSVVAKVAQAIAAVAGSRYMAPDVIIMHPRRWGWLTAQSDSNGRPYVVPTANGPQNARGKVDNANYGYVGDLQGLPVYTDANIPTTVSTSTITGATEDNIIVARSSDLLLWENGPAPRQFRFDETQGGSLLIKLVVADDSAFTAGWYPTGVAVISGSGMTTPVYP